MHRASVIVATACLFACACSIITNLDDLQGDAGGAPDATGDAMPDAPNEAHDDASDAPDEATATCDLAKDFGTPVPVAELDTLANDGAARLTHDELDVFFQRWPSADAGVPNGAGGFDLFGGTRTTTSATFGNIAVLGLDTTSTENDPTVTGDALTMFFSSDRNGGNGGLDVWVATRGAVTNDFVAQSPLASPINSTADDSQPYISSNGLTLYFSSTRDGGTSNLFRATRTTNTPFALDTTAFATVINDGHDSEDPVVTNDELTLFFSSDRAGNDDVYVATRASTSAPFDNPTSLVINSLVADHPTWISDDGCRLYIDSDRNGSRDIFLATRPP